MKLFNNRASLIATMGLGLSLVVTGMTLFGLSNGNLQAKSQSKPPVRSMVKLPPFQNITAFEKVTPSSVWNPTKVSVSTYEHVLAINNNGKKSVLDAKKQPMLFLAYWCPHCERTIDMWTIHQKQIKSFPLLVFVGYPDGTSLAIAKQRAWAELHYFHVPVKENGVYFVIGSKQTKYVPNGFPALFFERGHYIESLLGEHTWSIWKKVIGSSNGHF